MKRILCFLLAISLFSASALMNVNAENENLNEIFATRAASSQFNQMGTVKKGEVFSPDAMFDYTNMHTRYDEKYGIEDGSYTWTDDDGVEHKEYWKFEIPEEMFEAEVDKYFVLDGAAIEALHTLEEYNSDKKVYTTNMTGIGDSTTYVPYGYIDNGDGTYEFYAFYIDQADIGYYTPAEDAVLYKDYTVYSGSYCEIIHILRVNFQYGSSYLRFLSYEKNITDAPEADALILPDGQSLNTFFDNYGNHIFSFDSVFPVETIVTIENLTSETDVNEIISLLPENTDLLTAFDITAAKDNEKIQPDGAVILDAGAPVDFDPATQSLSLYYIDESGKLQKMYGAVIDDDGYVIMLFYIPHFSRYALVMENTPQEATLNVVEYDYLKGFKAGDKVGDYPVINFTKDKATLENNKLIGTGCAVKFDNYYEYTAVITGDTSGDGKINSTDFMQVRKQYLNLFDMHDAQALAADVNGDGKINSTDFMQIRRHYLGLYNLYN